MLFVVALQVTAHNASTVDIVFTKEAFKQVYANPDWPTLSGVNDVNRTLTAAPAKGSVILSFDVSCQSGDTAVQVPNALFYHGNGYDQSLAGAVVAFGGYSDQGTVTVDFSGTAAVLVPRLNQLTADMQSGRLGLHGLSEGIPQLARRYQCGWLCILPSPVLSYVGAVLSVAMLCHDVLCFCVRGACIRCLFLFGWR